MGWLGPITRVAGTAMAGHLEGKQKGQQIEREELKQALIREAQQRAEAREQERLDISRRNTEATILSRGAEQKRAEQDAEHKRNLLQIRVRALKRRPGYENMSDEELQAIAADPESFRHVMGLKPDPVAIHRAKRRIDNENPRPPRAPSPERPGAAAGRALSVVQKQLGEARADLKRTEDEQEPTVFRTPGDSVAFARRKQRAPRQRQRVDSLSSVRDSLADEVQGKPRRTSSTPAPKAPLSSLPPLTAAQKARANSDPEYRAFKESQGYTF